MMQFGCVLPKGLQLKGYGIGPWHRVQQRANVGPSPLKGQQHPQGNRMGNMVQQGWLIPARPRSEHTFSETLPPLLWGCAKQYYLCLGGSVNTSET